MVIRFGLMRIGRLSGYGVYDIIEMFRRGNVSVYDVYIHRKGLFSVTYGMTLRGEEEDIFKVIDIINSM